MLIAPCITHSVVLVLKSNPKELLFNDYVTHMGEFWNQVVAELKELGSIVAQPNLSLYPITT